MSITTWVTYRSPDERTKESFQKIVIESSCVEQHLPVAETCINALTLDNGHQTVLLLNGVREKYTLVDGYAIPTLQNENEILIKVSAIGLNPIDWKAPAFNFGIPALPWINGRDLAGTVVQVSAGCKRVQVGDVVLVPSTDYRDIRKAAFQEYAVTTHFNAVRIPSSISVQDGASLGVAFVSAALALGISFGLDFSLAMHAGPNLSALARQISQDYLPEDIRDECLSFSQSSNSESGPLKPGDWLAIWGASTTTGYITLQIAKLCGVRVICVADIARHGKRLLDVGADALVDRLDIARAAEIIRGITGGRLRFGLDTVGRDTATSLQQTLFITEANQPQSHLLGLTGIPKQRHPRITYHTVPIKIFHISETIGGSLTTWLETLLQNSSLILPEVVRAEGGLAGINDALERLRDGSISGKRIVVGL